MTQPLYLGLVVGGVAPEFLDLAVALKEGLVDCHELVLSGFQLVLELPTPLLQLQDVQLLLVGSGLQLPVAGPEGVEAFGVLVVQGQEIHFEAVDGEVGLLGLGVELLFHRLLLEEHLPESFRHLLQLLDLSLLLHRQFPLLILPRCQLLPQTQLCVVQFIGFLLQL